MKISLVLSTLLLHGLFPHFTIARHNKPAGFVKKIGHGSLHFIPSTPLATPSGFIFKFGERQGISQISCWRSGDFSCRSKIINKKAG